MLTYLAVKNIAVIEKVSLEFEKGLNVITGETGAGKSVYLEKQTKTEKIKHLSMAGQLLLIN